jgi:hypothetical protein
MFLHSAVVVTLMLFFMQPLLAEPKVSVSSEELLIYDSQRDGCTKDDISDAPMRAVRLADGAILGSAAWATNRLLRGKDFLSLRKQCAQALQSTRNPEPMAFDDWTWLMSFWSDNGKTIHALAHEEFQGHRFPGECESGKQMLCTYHAVTTFRSDDEGSSFRRVGKIPIAASRARYNRAANRMTGFRHPSNIILREGFYYTIIEATPEAEQKGGNCLFRTPDIADPTAWTYLTKNGWQPSSYNPYQSDSPPTPCEVISHLNGITWSLLRREATDEFVALLTVKSSQPDRVDLALATSKDLVNWSRPTPFHTIVAAWNNVCSEPYRYNYPSIIDPASPSRNFETIGKTALLFMSRIHMTKCSQTMWRDAVAYKISID